MKTPLVRLACAIALILPIFAADFDENTARLHGLLLNNPENPAVLTHFIDSWLVNSDQKSLAGLLQRKAAAGTVSDWRVLAAFQEFTGHTAAALTALDSAIKLTPADPPPASPTAMS